MQYTATYLPFRPDGTVDLAELGRIEQKGLREGLTDGERAAFDEARAHPEGAAMLRNARLEYRESLEREIQKSGGAIVTERWRNGVRAERTVQYFKPLVPATNGNGRARQRGAGRPKAKAGSRTSSSSSGDDDPPGPEPPRRRLCALCNRDIPPERAPQARYCSQRHAERHRKRRTRARHVAPRASTPTDERRYLKFEPGEPERLLLLAPCRCNGNHVLERDPELGHRCVKCGRQRPDSPIGKQTLGRLAGVVLS
jgi:hypothetical protein